MRRRHPLPPALSNTPNRPCGFPFSALNIIGTRSFTVLLLAAVAAGFAAPVSAAPGFWWWTPAQADQAVIRAKPPFVDGQRLPVYKANCVGQGRAVKTGPDAQYKDSLISPRSPYTFYRVFKCSPIVVLPSGKRTYSGTTSLWFRTSTKRRGVIACRVWSVNGEEIASRCPS